MNIVGPCENNVETSFKVSFDGLGSSFESMSNVYVYV